MWVIVPPLAGAMPGEFAVEKATHVRENAIDLVLTAQPVFLEPEDFSDCASVNAYVLTSDNGLIAPLYVEQIDDFTVRLTLDRTVEEGEALTASLSEHARAIYGQVTNTAAVAFTGTYTGSKVSPVRAERGADFQIPMASNQSASFALLSKSQAYRERLILLCETKKGMFAHLSDWGRGIEPKKNYSLSDLDDFARDIQQAITADPDTKSCSVQYYKGIHSVRFEITATPNFSDSSETFDVKLGAQ